MIELATILRREHASADSYHDQIAILQNQAFQYYEAQPFGNENEGRSQIVLPDVQETIDYMTQSVLRTFVSGDRAVEFEAVEQADEDAAEDATAAINYLFLRRQDGYRILHDVVIDGLLLKYGVFKTVVEEEAKVTRERVTGHPMHAGLLPPDTELTNIVDNGDDTLTADAKHTTRVKVYRDYAIPPGEFRFSSNACSEDDADYLAHVSQKTRSALVEMGFDQEQVYGLPAFSQFRSSIDQNMSVLDTQWNDTTTPALEKVLLCEEYCRIDMDGDGIAERIKAFRVENEILLDADTKQPAVETIDEQPFAVFCPFPRQHKLVGYSLADKVMDIQLGRSFVARQLFDGMAFGNMPRPIIDMSAASNDTLDDILSPIPGSPIRTKGPGAVTPFETGFDVGKSLQVMEWMTGERESRTGITRLNQGLDADALNKTATGTALMQAQGQQQEEYVARNLAEAVGRLFAKKYRLMKSEGIPVNIKVDGEYKKIDPSRWPDEFNVAIRVGLGSGSKDKRIQYRMTLAPLMSEGMMQGMVSPQNVYNMMDGLIRDMNLGTGDDFWLDPTTPEGQQAAQAKAQQPNPQAAAAQAKMQDTQTRAQIDQQKLQVGAQTDQLKAQTAVQTAASAQASAQQIAQMKIDAAREETNTKAFVEQQRTEASTNLEMYKHDSDQDTKLQIASLKGGAGE